MFSSPVEVVRNTSIFARMEGTQQYLAYSMSFGANSDLAMIWPLPTAPSSGDDAVTFVDLSECPSFFDALSRYFLVEMMSSFDADELGMAGASDPPLVVHEVGSFEASFVPEIASFARLDARFRLSDELWSRLPQYGDHGFAVFKLKAGRDKRIHPMALRFPTRDPSRLFFPTLHVHDGNVAAQADFDHALYCQGTPQHSASWEASSGPIENHAALGDDIDQRLDPATPAIRLSSETTKGVVAFGQPAWKLGITGRRTNEDVLVPMA